jgi:copper resistance protein B
MEPMSSMQMVDVMGMDDKAMFGLFSLDRFEHLDTEAGSVLAWSLQGWLGGDFDRFAFRSEGIHAQGRIEQADVELLWSHAVASYWDSTLGIRRDLGRGTDRSWAAIGVQGLAPYGIHLSATAYLGERGHTAARLEAEYALLLTQRLVLQPRFEVNAYGKGDPTARIGAGIADAEMGLRLAYEIRREFAPYIGIERHQLFGTTADLANAMGEGRGDTQWLVGVRLWF